MNDFDNAFIRIPKILFYSHPYASLSVDAKMLYGLLDDRKRLSQKNGWKDFEGRTYLYYTVLEIAMLISCSEKKARMLLKELEEAGLIERRKNGQGKPAPGPSSPPRRRRNTSYPARAA